MITQALAKNIVATTYESLPEEAREAAKKSVLDTLGVMFPPTTLVDTCISVYDLMQEAGGKPESTLIGFGGKAPCWVAGFVNGSLTHAIDFDDCVGLEKPIMHPSGSTLPAAFAMAERVGRVSGKEFITAMALGNDLSVRLGGAPRGNVVWGYPFFPVTTFGIFSATAASGKLLGLTESQMVNALGLALNRVSGVTKGLFGSDLRAIRDGINNREGILCALLASKGMEACKDAVELLYSVYYNNDIDPDSPTADLGKHFRGSEVGFKPWPSCQGTHSYIQGVLQIVNEHKISPDEVGEIILEGNSEGEGLCNPPEIKRKPTSSITAKVALPFVMGVAIKHRNISIANFLPENLDDPQVLETAKKVRFHLNPALGSYSSRVNIKTRDGQSYEARVDVLRGSIGNPLSTAELIAKFKDCSRYARKPLSPGNIDRLINDILEMEKIEDINTIMGLLS
ncbi:MAG: MmgE/PrpD family protein [Dehalococcoidales bacterium]|nr:MmgE/PrpD family protein [Dehalococcoidales bacterium]